MAPPSEAGLDIMLSVLRNGQKEKEAKPVFRYFEWLSLGEPEHEPKAFYETFYAVRSILNQLLARVERPDDYRYWELSVLSAGLYPIDNTRVKPVEITAFGDGPLAQEIHIQDGRLEFGPSSLLRGFQNVFTGVEMARLRRCPVCTAFFYAVRANKGACDKHLILARTWKIREKTPEYRKNWQINKLVKSGRSLDVARATVVFRSKTRNSATGGN
jgi:hypothetical protein